MSESFDDVTPDRAETSGVAARALPAAGGRDAIPAELRERQQWVNWQYRTRDGQQTKVPVNPRTGRNAAPDNPATWGTFDEVVAAADKIGFVFTADDPYFGVDLDACRNPATGELTPWADRIVKRLNTFTDVSPSGFGVKMIGRGKIKPGHNVKKLKGVPTFGDKAPEIALYDHARFWCLTGDSQGAIEERQPELDFLFDELWPTKSATEPKAEEFSVKVTPEQKFMQLVAACRDVVKGERSERDFALCTWAKRNRFDCEAVWEAVCNVGKFAECGREYFDRTWAKASVAVANEPAIDAGIRTLIEITTAENEINAEVAKRLGNDPSLYVRGGALATIGDVDGEPTIVRLPDALIRDRIAAAVQFWARAKQRQVAKHPPDWVVKAMAAWNDWSHMRLLRGVVTVPTIRPDGSLLDAPGYDPATQLVYVPSGCRPIVPPAPTYADALVGRDLLLDIVCDFPFAQESHRAAWLAYLVTLIGRYAFNGPSPLFAIDATTAGTGKGLSADATFLIAFGREAYRWANPSSDDEARKRITSLAISGRPAVLIDNVAGVFGSPAMDAALTAVSWGDRLLGVNKDVQLPLRIVWGLTANNLIVNPDTTRRIAPIRLESKMEQPETRTGFKYAELLAHVKQHRAELLAAGLTILRAWFVAGCPRQPLPAWGSFEGWSSVIRQAVVWLGLPDPASTREAFRTVADRESTALRELIDGIASLDPKGEGMKAAEILDRSAEDRGLRSALAELCGEKLTSRTIGCKLAGIRGRIIGGRYIDIHQVRGGYQAWLVRSAETTA